MEDNKSIFSDTYEVIDYLQSGSGGMVYKAYHKRLKKEVVLKRIKKKSANMKINRQEVDILKNLNHMYLPQVLDFLSVDGEIFTVISFVPGKSFKELLDEGAHFKKKQLICWGMQLCSALHYLHNQNPPIIHGDIKPANMMLTPQGNICLIDFNISFFMDDSMVWGYTEGYTSPEQYIVAVDKKSASAIPERSIIDEKSDIYSVGATFYHLITGEKLKRQRDGYEETRLVNAVGEAFAGVILKAVNPDRKKRFANVYEMYLAFQTIYKKDDRYKNLLVKQRIARGTIVTLLGLSILTVGYGIYTLKQEKLDRYNALVEKQTDFREAGEYEKEKKAYKKAVKLLPGNLEAYYQNADILFIQQEYQKCIEFVEYDVLQNEKADLLDERLSDLYFLEAESYLELEEYDAAVDAFGKIYECDNFKEEYYRDYAIALAYEGDLEKAGDILNKAIKQNLTEDSIYYAKGEIEKASSEWEQAEDDLRRCIEITEDEELKMRAYILISEIYDKQDKKNQKRTILTEATNVLPAEKQMMILEKLAQVDIDLADEGQTELLEEAIKIENSIIEQGWESYTTYNNLAILNQKQGNLGEAEQILNEMEDRYGDDYNIEKRFAYLEIDYQEQNDIKNRDYSKFAAYYDKAEKMYYDQLKNNKTDTEMQLLENIYQQVRSGGWLE